MAESVYKIIELVGTSTGSLGKGGSRGGGARRQVPQEYPHCREIAQLDLQINGGKVNLPRQSESLVQVRRRLSRPA